MAEKTSSADGKEAGDALPLRPAIASSLRSFGEQSPRSGPAKGRFVLSFHFLLPPSESSPRQWKDTNVSQ